MDLHLQLEQVKTRIAQACTQAKRNKAEIKLLAVSKTFPLSNMLQLVQLGQHDFGENYVQEAETKLNAAKQEQPENKIQWHFIGPLQSNKTKFVAEQFDWVHSVDRLKIAQRLSKQRPSNKPAINVLIQVNTSNEPSKSGAAPDQVLPLCLEIQHLPNLKLCGLMTIASNTNNSEQLEKEFTLCRTLLEQLKSQGISSACELSMGMSSDLELAIKHGATIVRVGSALFGQRTVQA